MMQPLPWSRLAAATLLTMLVAAAPGLCQTKANWSQPFHIAGVRLGMSAEEVRKAGGAPLETRNLEHVLFLYGSARADGLKSVSFDKQGHCYTVCGATLSQGSRLILHATQDMQSVRAMLGEPTAVVPPEEVGMNACWFYIHAETHTMIEIWQAKPDDTLCIGLEWPPAGHFHHGE